MIRNLFSIGVFFLFFCGCTWDKYDPDYKNYPADIGKIMLTKCSVTGCHNDASKEAAAGLSLSSWEKMFEGSRNNAAVIPYSANQSFLMFFINTFPDLGPTILPVMPLNKPPLSRNEVITIRDWINNGAPSSNGFVKFSDNPARSKIYIINQGCDLVSVIDRESKLIMRYFTAGSAPAIESPHKIKISPDGQYIYICFYAGNTLQKFRTTDESFVSEAVLGYGSWNTFIITSDSKRAFVVNWNANGSIAVVDLQNMTLLNMYQGSGLLEWPHGSALYNDSTLYVTAQSGNFIYKIDVSDVFNPGFSQIVLQPGETPSSVKKYDPHDIHFSPDKTQYAVSCQNSSEVRFFSSANDSLIAVVPTGKFTQEVEFSTSTDYLFVSCMEDNVSFPGTTGSVSVINYKTHTFIKSIYTGYQPHGIEPDDDKKIVYVPNRNVNPNGPAPHHTTTCGGRNGYLTIIDMNTLTLLPGYRAELSVDPYYIAIRE